MTCYGIQIDTIIEQRSHVTQIGNYLGQFLGLDSPHGEPAILATRRNPLKSLDLPKLWDISCRSGQSVCSNSSSFSKALVIRPLLFHVLDELVAEIFVCQEELIPVLLYLIVC